MSLKIRLAKTKNTTSKYRVIVAETRSKRDGKTIDIIGSPDKINQTKLKKWLSLGAQMSKAVSELNK